MIAVEVVDILNELVAREQRSLAFRLAESIAFVSEGSIVDDRLIAQMRQRSSEHCAWLVEVITKHLHGVPGLRVGDLSSADLHFQELRWALPRLLEDQESIVRTYRSAVSHVTGNEHAADIVGRILIRHESDLAKLQERCADSPAASG